jgi:hypothetical protein
MQRPRRFRRGFSLPLVMVLGVIGLLAVGTLLFRRNTSLFASDIQSDSYVAHHFQFGVRDLVMTVLQTSRRVPESRLSGGTIGFDAELEGGLTLEVRLRDAQGSVLLWADDTPSIRLTVLRRAIRSLVDQQLQDERYLRAMGPPRVSVHAAEKETLSAMIRGIDPEANGDQFADSIIEARQTADLTVTELRSRAQTAGVKADRLELVDAMLTTESNLWWVQARILDSQGRPVFQQGGLMQGGLRPGIGASSASWQVLHWGEIPADGLAGFRENRR